MDVILNRVGAARFLTVSLSTLDRLISSKDIPFKKVRVGKASRVLFSQEELSEWITTHTGDLEDPKVLKEFGSLILEDRNDTKNLIENSEKLRVILKNLIVITQKEIDEGEEESEPLEGDEGDILKTMQKELILLLDKIKKLEKQMFERAQKRFGLEKKIKKLEVKKAPYKIFEAAMSVDPRLPKR